VLDSVRPRSDYPLPVSQTFRLSFEAVARANRAAAQWLQLCAHLSPDDQRLDLMVPARAPAGASTALGRAGLRRLPAPLARAVADPVAFDAVLAELQRYSLVNLSEDGRSQSMHRFVQAVIRDLSAAEATSWAEIAAWLTRETSSDELDKLLNAFFRAELPQPWPKFDPPAWGAAGKAKRRGGTRWVLGVAALALLALLLSALVLLLAR
jgi:hypothetical protein